MKGIAGVSLVMALTFPALVTASAAESRFHYHYYKEKVPLVEETGSVAVFDEAQGPPEDLAHLLDRAGFRDPDLRGFHGRGWSIARMRSASDALSAFPTLTVDQLEGYFRISAVDLGTPGKDDFFGSGLANAHIALKVAAIEAIYIDGFESGDTSMWTSTEP